VPKHSTTEQRSLRARDGSGLVDRDPETGHAAWNINGTKSSSVSAN